MSREILGNDKFREFLLNQVIGAVEFNWPSIKQNIFPDGTITIEEVKEELKRLFVYDKATEEIFLTVYTRTKGGTEGVSYTFARTMEDGLEKVNKYYADRHNKMLEQYGDQAGEKYGTEPPTRAYQIASKDKFIP